MIRLGKSLKTILTCISILFITVTAVAQNKNFIFESFDTSDGLSSSTCLSIYQDSKGYLWFGTIDGLNKYNGYGFKVYKSIRNDSTSISNNRINAIVEDKNQYLWIGTNNGLNLFNPENERFELIDLYQHLSLSNNPRKFINDLLFDESNNALWVATNYGVIRIQLEDFKGKTTNLKFFYYFHDSDNHNSIDDNIVNSLIRDRKGEIWANTDGKNLNKYNKANDNFERVQVESENDFSLNHIPNIVFVDSENDFWIGNSLSNIVIWNQNDNSFNNVSFTQKDIAVRDFYLDENGVIWASTDGHGLFLIDKEEKRVKENLIHDYSDPFSIPNDKPSTIYRDKDKNLWIGSYDKGVSKYDPTQNSFGHHYYKPGSADGLNEKIVQSVLQDSKERIWISAYGGGLNLFNEEKDSFLHFTHDPNNQNSISSNKILYTFESKSGDIWVCTLDGGINKFDPDSRESVRFLHDPDNLNSIGQNSVWSGVEDNNSRLWLGLRTEGLSLYDEKTKNFYNYKNINGVQNNLASNFVFFIYIDRKNRLLVGTSLGLNYIDLDQLENRIPKYLDFAEVPINGIKDNLVNYITEDYLGNIWVGADTGIYKLDSNFKLLKSYSSKDGLPNNLVVGLTEDDNHKIWVTSKSGLSYLDPVTHQFQNFNVHDRIQGPEYQSKSIDKTKDGRIIAGGINGFNIFNPNDIEIDRSANLQPKITNLKINNQKVAVEDTVNGRVILQKPLAETSSLELQYHENYLSFEFLALHFKNQERVKYAYRLDGLEESFQNFGNQREVNYSNLVPGNYEFQIKASLDDHWEDAPISKMSFTILSPPWKTWWAYSLYALLFITLLWFGIYIYTKRVREEQEHEMDQMKLQFFVNLSHEFRTPLTLILNPVQKILSDAATTDAAKSSAVTIQRSARRLLHLVNQLLDYRKMDVGMYPLRLEHGNIVSFCEDIFLLFTELADKKNIDYRFESNTESIGTLFDFDKLEKIITNLITNAIKFTDTGGSIKLSIKKQSSENSSNILFKHKQFIEITVQDSGIGLNENQLKNIFQRFYHPDSFKAGTGIGLNFTKALVELHGGSISVESKREKGSKFKVLLPLDTTSNTEEVKNEKNEYLFNSVNAVEYEMAMSNDEAKSNDDSNENRDSNASKPTILIVEDNRELRTHIRKDLCTLYHIKEANHGKDGLELAKKWQPDIIVSDVMMPEMNGFEMCQILKTDFDTCHIPILLLTAKTLDTDRIDGYNSGADAYLEKPFVTSVLLSRVQNLLEARKRLRQRFSEIGGLFPSKEVTTNNMDEAFLDKATKVVLDHIDNDNLRQEDIFKEIGMGRSQFYRKINSITGNNPSHFIRTIRLRYASELLQQNCYSIKEVTHMCGFNSTAYFSKTFKELFKMTPTEYVEKTEKMGI
ncbi:signal transduction histidine kinase [Flavobacteriaceae bacterium MAR_2009_75]|nr:signal transduction histidine kinase [Flavobacteriaceae bacterium MAR_2009_75]